MLSFEIVFIPGLHLGFNSDLTLNVVTCVKFNIFSSKLVHLYANFKDITGAGLGNRYGEIQPNFFKSLGSFVVKEGTMFPINFAL